MSNHTDDRIRDLEKLLAEEKAKASLAEVAHLQAVVKWFVDKSNV